MTAPQFSFTLRDLETGHKIVRTKMSAEWLGALLSGTEVEPQGDGEASLTLSKNGVEVLVRGHLDLTVAVPCARTLEPAIYRLHPEVFLLLGPATGPRPPEPFRLRRDAARKAAAPPAGRGGKGAPGAKAATTTKAAPATKAAPGGKGAGGKPTGPGAKAGGKSSRSWDDDPELLDEDAARDTYSGDLVVLDDFLREFILLEVPMVPLREDLRSSADEASPSPPGGSAASGLGPEPGSSAGDKPLDPRLSPLADLKARLEKKKE